MLRLADNPALADQIGHDIVTASGTTLLGADDKAGVAEIVTAAACLIAHPEIPHGPIRIASGLKDKEAMIERLAREAAAAYPGARVEVAVEESYRNMKEILDRHPAIADHAREAIRRAGLEPRTHRIRGGTDGCRLSFMGLPTPNLFAGEHNFHSRLETAEIAFSQRAPRSPRFLPTVCSRTCRSCR